MKDSTKLFLSALVVAVCGFLKGVAPTVLEKPFDGAGFLSLLIIAAIIAILGLIKYLKGK